MKTNEFNWTGGFNWEDCLPCPANRRARKAQNLSKLLYYNEQHDVRQERYVIAFKLRLTEIGL